MKVCEQGHEAIVFDDSAYRAECPLCKANQKIEDLEAEVEGHKDTISELREEISALEGDG